ncbi:leucine-rich repeats and immunoglobulin-like domains protein 3 [Eurytemora carolleeae]|uniref:leucine-rich repeats and immunoglobulin-like domains protein 3 n=1 Tax=Eurytemora carolleeae TaxID=1294199 RepID=UPI000C7651D0|nr:leucine-rich repeats and immunoglobulin-like domains protein 3 [Eurytemora carolleeae]|eukprot:XP_023331085.1 leucine-rich repeats and immunoglobulin-like domains protein 3 [Eurytemora affinis]
MIKKITLDHNRIFNIEPFAFKGLHDVEEISLRWNPIETIPGFAFAGIRNVTHIYLGYNKIKSISGYAFAGTEHIEILVINDNPIKTIESYAFAGLKYVKFLLVSSTVKQLHQDAFNGLESVDQLKLDFFNLRTTKPHTFRGLTNCRVLTIDNSDLGLVAEGAWSGILNVSQVNLFNSKIDQIADTSLATGSQVHHLNLTGNHILSLSPDLQIEKFVTYGLKSIYLSRNHIPCTCHFAVLQDQMADIMDLSVLQADNYCISPQDVSGKNLAHMSATCYKTGLKKQNSVQTTQERSSEEDSNLKKGNIEDDSPRQIGRRNENEDFWKNSEEDEHYFNNVDHLRFNKILFYWLICHCLIGNIFTGGTATDRLIK